MDRGELMVGPHGLEWTTNPRRFTQEFVRSPARLEQLMELLARYEGRTYVPGSSHGLDLTELQWVELENAVRALGHSNGQSSSNAPVLNGDEIDDGDVNTDEGESVEDAGHVAAEADESAEVSGMAAEEAGAEDDAMSDTSSAMYDPEADPDAYARRLDELAGVLEMGEQEARSMRWGIAADRKGPVLSIADFKALINHHLAATEWKYSSGTPIRDSRTGPRGSGVESFEHHPISILGSDRGNDAELPALELPEPQTRDMMM